MSEQTLDGKWRRAWDTDNDGTRTYELPVGEELYGEQLQPGDTFWVADRHHLITVTDVCTRLAEEHGGVHELSDHVHFIADWPADDPAIDRRGHVEASFFADRLDDGTYVPHRNNDATPD